MNGVTSALALLALQAPVAGELPAPAFAAESEEVDSVEASTDVEDRMTVPVNIAGQGPFRFLIDTGSQRTVVSSALASRLGLDLGPESRIISIGGTAVVRTARLDGFALGRKSYVLETVPLLEKHNMGADGIIGTDSLQGQRVMIDFVRDVIEIGSSKSLGGDKGYEIIVTAHRRSGQLVMTDAMLDGIKLTVIIDTGAGLSVGNRALQDALSKRRAGSEPVTLKDVTGNTLVADLGYARKLAIKDFSITNLIIGFADTPAFTALDLDESPALFLGMRELRLFERVAVDFRKRRVFFDLPPH